LRMLRVGVGWRKLKIDDIKDKIESSVIALATCDKNNNPHNIAIMYAKVKDNKIIVTDNYMKKTKENILLNPRIALVFWRSFKEWKIRGVAEYYDFGKWLEFVKALKENKDEPCKGAVVISIKEVIEI